MAVGAYGGIVVPLHHRPFMAAGYIGLLFVAGRTLLNDLNLAPLPGLHIVDVCMTLHAGESLPDVVDAACVFPGLLFVTNAAIGFLRDVDPLGVFFQVDDIHMATGTGIGPVHRVGVLFALYGVGVTLHAILGEDGPLHLDIYRDL